MTRRGLQQELAALQARLRLPTLHVTHDLEEARCLADRLLPLSRGKTAPEWLEAVGCLEAYA